MPTTNARPAIPKPEPKLGRHANAWLKAWAQERAELEAYEAKFGPLEPEGATSDAASEPGYRQG